jgi:hypothetical protein
VTWYGQSLSLRQSGSPAYDSYDVPGRIDMTMADAPDLGLLWSVLVYACAALLPLLAKHLVSKLAGGWDALWILLVKRVHNRVCDGERFVLESRVTRESLDDLAKRGEVPKQAPSGHIRDDKIGRSQLEESVRLQTREHVP